MGRKRRFYIDKDQRKLDMDFLRRQIFSILQASIRAGFMNSEEERRYTQYNQRLWELRGGSSVRIADMAYSASGG